MGNRRPNMEFPHLISLQYRTHPHRPPPPRTHTRKLVLLRCSSLWHEPTARGCRVDVFGYSFGDHCAGVQVGWERRCVHFHSYLPAWIYIFAIRVICGYENHHLATNVLKGDPDKHLVLLPLIIAAIVSLFFFVYMRVLLTLLRQIDIFL